MIKKIKMESVAIGLSFVCAIHCLATPLLTLILPFLGEGSIVEEVLHNLVLFIAVPIGAISLAIGYQKHKCTHTITLGISGILLLLPHVFKLRTIIGFPIETTFTAMGSILLAIALYRNNIKTKRCILPNCHKHHS